MSLRPLPLSDGQRRLLQVARRQVGLDETTWRDLLERVTGSRSAKDMSQPQFDAVVRDLERGGFRSTSSRKPFGSRPGMASATQVAKLRHLWKEYTLGQGTDRTLGVWLDRQGWASDMRFLRHEPAGLAIAALTAMCARRARQLQASPPPAA